MGCLVSTFTVRINLKFFPLAVRSTQKVPTQIAGNVRCLQCSCCLATDIWKNSRLNWKLKIRNAADNADITQSLARDTRHRRMQEVNSLWTDSWPLRANTVLCSINTIQQCSYSSNQFKVILLAYALRTRNLPKFLATSDAGCIFDNTERFG